jgi:predicted RNase H-like nuclease (RuvC/YqgF family)
MTDNSDLKTDIALIHKDIAQIEKTLSKLDSTLDNISGISRTLALQERTVDGHERRLDEIDEKISRHNKEEEDFRKELQKQIQDLSESNRDYIQEFKFSNAAEREARHREVLASIDAMRKELKDKNREQDAKITTLENWRWWIMGIGVTVTAILTLAWKSFFG